MRHPFSFLAIGLCVLIAQPVALASGTADRYEMSAAKKKKPQRHLERKATPTLAAQRGWFDPSLGPDGKPWPNPYPPGTCATDMGYGRFSTCDFYD